MSDKELDSLVRSLVSDPRHSLRDPRPEGAPVDDLMEKAAEKRARQILRAALLANDVGLAAVGATATLLAPPPLDPEAGEPPALASPRAFEGGQSGGPSVSPERPSTRVGSGPAKPPAEGRWARFRIAGAVSLLAAAAAVAFVCFRRPEPPPFAQTPAAGASTGSSPTPPPSLAGPVPPKAEGTLLAPENVAAPAPDRSASVVVVTAPSGRSPPRPPPSEESPSPHPAPVASVEGPTNLPEMRLADLGPTQNPADVPTQGALLVWKGKFEPLGRGCVAGATGATLLAVTFSSAGTVTSVAVEGWAADHGRADCLAAAAKRIRTDPFLRASHRITIPVRP